jgi:heme/copper-type cytochrome/quinol oxidase subunit 3
MSYVKKTHRFGLLTPSTRTASFSTFLVSPLAIFGGLILFFLIVEPHGLARLWQITKEKLRLWPFPH